MDRTYYSVDQIAELLRIHPKTIQRYIREGSFRPEKSGKAGAYRARPQPVYRRNENSGRKPGRGFAARRKIRSEYPPLRTSRWKTGGGHTHRQHACRGAQCQAAGIWSVKHARTVSGGGRESSWTLWGNARFAAEMMGFLSALTEERGVYK
jgi:excisionase family DNA binding protein